MKYLLAYDIGTTGVKTCLFGVERTFELLAAASRSYPLYVLPDGGAEQSGEDWWRGMCESTRELFSGTKVSPSEIAGISFCSQMQGLVLTA